MKKVEFINNHLLSSIEPAVSSAEFYDSSKALLNIETVSYPSRTNRLKLTKKATYDNAFWKKSASICITQVMKVIFQLIEKIYRVEFHRHDKKLLSQKLTPFNHRITPYISRYSSIFLFESRKLLEQYSYGYNSVLLNHDLRRSTTYSTVLLNTNEIITQSSYLVRPIYSSG